MSFWSEYRVPAKRPREALPPVDPPAKKGRWMIGPASTLGPVDFFILVIALVLLAGLVSAETMR